MRAEIFRSGLVLALVFISGCAFFPEKKNLPIHNRDSTITQQIKSSYAQNQMPGQNHVTVETLYGVVLLSGVLKTPQQKIAAQMLAEQVNGVKAVHNHILVQPHSDTSTSVTSIQKHNSLEL